MCGGAIISGIITPARSRRLTADYLWPDLKKSGSKKLSGRKHSKKPAIGFEDDFEADFQVFKDEESGVDDFDDDVDDVLADVKSFAFSATKTPSPAVSHGKNIINNTGNLSLFFF